MNARDRYAAAVTPRRSNAAALLVLTGGMCVPYIPRCHAPLLR
jgi:hypothetical protein